MSLLREVINLIVSNPYIGNILYYLNSATLIKEDNRKSTIWRSGKSGTQLVMYSIGTPRVSVENWLKINVLSKMTK